MRRYKEKRICGLRVSGVNTYCVVGRERLREGGPISTESHVRACVIKKNPFHVVCPSVAFEQQLISTKSMLHTPRIITRRISAPLHQSFTRPPRPPFHMAMSLPPQTFDMASESSDEEMLEPIMWRITETNGAFTFEGGHLATEESFALTRSILRKWEGANVILEANYTFHYVRATLHEACVQEGTIFSFLCSCCQDLANICRTRNPEVAVPNAALCYDEDTLGPLSSSTATSPSSPTSLGDDRVRLRFEEALRRELEIWVLYRCKDIELARARAQ